MSDDPKSVQDWIEKLPIEQRANAYKLATLAAQSKKREAQLAKERAEQEAKFKAEKERMMQREHERYDNLVGMFAMLSQQNGKQIGLDDQNAMRKDLREDGVLRANAPYFVGVEAALQGNMRQVRQPPSAQELEQKARMEYLRELKKFQELQNDVKGPPPAVEASSELDFYAEQLNNMREPDGGDAYSTMPAALRAQRAKFLEESGLAQPSSRKRARHDLSLDETS